MKNGVYIILLYKTHFLPLYPKLLLLLLLLFFPLKMCTWWELASWMPLFVVGSLPTTLGLVTTQNSKDLIVTTKIHVEPHFTKGKWVIF